ncbi:hypothetical protein MTR62_21140, partial [Novosphingobium sp. 1949]
AMPIAQFENSDETPLTLTVQPWGDHYIVPHLAVAGIRYSLRPSADDRSYTEVAKGSVEFWCNADTYECEIVYPSVFRQLSWDICVNGGWCGGIVDGNPTTVDDLLPRTGRISARKFAELTMVADGWPNDEQLEEKYLRWLQAKFVQHVGANSVDAEEFLRDIEQPFGNASS